MMKRQWLIAILIVLFLSEDAEAANRASIRIISYNVENLFDTEKDSLHSDDDFLPEGKQHWFYSRYRDKLSHIAQVIAAIGEWTPPAIVGLIEVENQRCLNDLTQWHLRKHYPYRSLLIEGPDARGIDPGLLFDTTRLQLLQAASIPVALPHPNEHTRDILYCRFLPIHPKESISSHTDSKADTISHTYSKADTISHTLKPLHLFLCHFPSQRGGAAESDDKREAARLVLYAAVSSILQEDSSAYIIAMGDFNMQPEDNMLPLLHNLMLTLPTSDKASHKFQGKWTYLDQFYASPALLQYVSTPEVFSPDWLLEEDAKYMGVKPYRTDLGPRYLGGYSDHLPIYIDLTLTNQSQQPTQE